MDTTPLGAWRDAALILLGIQAMVLGLLLGAGLYWGLRGVRQLLQWIRPVLFETRLRVWRILSAAQRIMRVVAAPFVWVHSTLAGLQRALQMLGWR
jgi:hypothetical protein